MAFPETRLTLILRLAEGGSQADWGQFLKDYWGPMVRFAARRGQLPLDQAEDVASETFLVLVRSPLFARWHANPTARLRSLLCGVVGNVLANRQRVEQGRKRLLQQAAESGGVPDALPVHDSPEPTANDLDVFYHAWADELLARTMRQLLLALHAEGRGDYFRALHGRVCEGLSAAQIGEALGVPAATIENYLRVSRSRLSAALTEAVRQDVERYSKSGALEADFSQEWAALQEHLEQFGGLESALRKEASSLDRLPAELAHSRSFRLTSTKVLAEAKKESKSQHN